MSSLLAHPPGGGGADRGTAPVPTSPASAPGATAEEPRLAGRVHRWAAVGLLVLATGSFFPLLGGGGEADVPLARLLWAVAYVGAGLALFDGALRHRLRVRVSSTLVLYVALAAVSVTWSVLPALSLRRSVGLAGTVVVGMYLAQRLRPLELLDALRAATLIVAVSSLLLYASGSALALDEVHGTLRGVLSTKNTLGRMMALGILASATTALLDGRLARRCTLSALPMLVALALTDSTGGSLVAAGVVVCMVAALLWRARAGRALLLAAVALSLGALAILLPQATAERVTGLVGEDATLTGRTEIWRLSLEAVGSRPVLGYGYEAFWEGSDVAARIQARLNWPVPSAHNGLLDVAVDLGLVGVVLAVLVLLTLVARGLRDVAAGFVPGAFLRLPIAGLIVVSTMVESGLLQQNTLLTVLLVAALSMPGEQARADRLAPASAVDDVARGRPVRPRAATRSAVLAGNRPG
jgi:exopolysaccharide production protein ExoQ